jgi:2-succinyl-6-hydroxy-2,4-cyclohexadiene-1-carboxylate synthase
MRSQPDAAEIPSETVPGSRGRRVALIHGFTQTRRCWGPVPEMLADHGEIVTVDAPGHGAAADLAMDLPTAGGRYAAALGTSVLIGYSMGGRLALHAALARPDLVAGLVLVGASPGIADDAERGERRRADEALAERILDIGVPAFVNEWLHNPLFAGLGPDNDQRAERLTNTAEGLASSLRLAGTGAQEPLWEMLGTITCPVLCVTGGDDVKFTTMARTMAARFGGPCDVEVVPGAGHSVHLENPGAFAATVTTWLSGLTGGEAVR